MLAWRPHSLADHRTVPDKIDKLDFGGAESGRRPAAVDRAEPDQSVYVAPQTDCCPGSTATPSAEVAG